MGAGLFRGCCTPGKSGNDGSLALPPRLTSGSLERWMHRLANKSTSQPHGILCEFGCNQESVAASTWVNSVVAVPALIPGPHLGAHESRTVSRTDWFCELFPNRCIVEDLIAPWAKSAAAFRKEVYFLI